MKNSLLCAINPKYTIMILHINMHTCYKNKKLMKVKCTFF